MSIQIIALLTTIAFLLAGVALAVLAYLLICAGHPAFAAIFGLAAIGTLFSAAGVEVKRV